MPKSPILDSLAHAAGYGVGALSALTSIKGGGLQNYLLNRQRAIEDPAVRASLVGSPFAAGTLFQSGSDVPAAAPGTMPPAAAPAQPSDGLPATSHAIASPNDVQWLQQNTTPWRRYVPDLPPLPAETQVQVQAAQGIVSGLQSSDPAVRAQAKLAGKIPLTPEETGQIIEVGKKTQAGLGPGGTVGVEVPGMPVTIGSPYSVSPVGYDEYATPGEALAVAQTRGTNWGIEQTNRGTWKPVQKTPPAAPPTPAPQGPQPQAPAAQGQQPPASSAAQPPAPPTQRAAPTVPTAPPPSQAPASPPPPPPPPLDLWAGIPQPPKAPAYAGRPWDLNAPAPGARRGLVGYPSAAFDDTGAAAAPAAAPPELLAAPPEAVAVAPAPATATPWAPPTPPARAQGAAGALEPQAFVQGMVNRGWSVPEASAAAGNVHVESAFRPSVIAPDGGTGLLQWNGARLAGMQRYAAATGRDWRDPEAQMDWIAMERSGDSRHFGVDERGGYRKAFAGGGAPADMAATFGHYVERPADLSATVAQRSAMAATYGGGGAPTRAVMPAAAPAVASPSMFARVFAPASAEAAEIPPSGAVVAYPSPAFREGAAAAPTADIVPPGPPQPPAQPVPPVPPAPPGAPAPPVEPQTKPGANVPLSRISVRGADGTEYSYDYGSPSDYARQLKEAGITSLETASKAQLEQLDKIQQRDLERRLTTEADISRFLRPQTAEEKNDDAVLEMTRKAVGRLYEDFPKPSDRDMYIGWLNRPRFELVQLVHDNPGFGRFVQDLEPFSRLQSGDVPSWMRATLGPYVPSGDERHARDFEQHLFDFKNELYEQQQLRNAANRMPAGQVTPAWWDATREGMRNQRIGRASPDELAAMGLQPSPRAPSGEQPPTVELAPPPQGPITYYGHSVAPQ